MLPLYGRSRRGQIGRGAEGPFCRGGCAISIVRFGAARYIRKWPSRRWRRESTTLGDGAAAAAKAPRARRRQQWPWGSGLAKGFVWRRTRRFRRGGAGRARRGHHRGGYAASSTSREAAQGLECRRTAAPVWSRIAGNHARDDRSKDW